MKSVVLLLLLNLLVVNAVVNNVVGVVNCIAVSSVSSSQPHETEEKFNELLIT